MTLQIENIQSQMRKGLLEYCILAVIKHKESYPTEIIEQLKRVDLIIIEGTLYPLLTRLKNSGLLAYRWEESPSGPPRKYFSITEDGDKMLKQLHQSWKQLSDSISHITHNLKP